jgi:hypothetical protein
MDSWAIGYTWVTEDVRVAGVPSSQAGRGYHQTLGALHYQEIYTQANILNLVIKPV